MLEAALAVASIAAMMAMKVCGSALSLKPSENSKTNIEIPIAYQMDPMARLVLVAGFLLRFRAMMTAVSTPATVMVMGQAR